MTPPLEPDRTTGYRLIDELHRHLGIAKNPLYAHISIGDSANLDAFSRLRTASAKTTFDTKLTHDNEPEFWEESQVSGAGTGSFYSIDRASVAIYVSNGTIGKRVRQTYARPNYQPGKSQMILMTCIMGGSGSGIIRETGQFDDENGLFFRNDGGTMKVVRKTHVTGSAVDNEVAQSSWNIDTFDGNGNSGITLDFTKTQIFVIDYQWLGVGRVRFGFDIDGVIYYCHEMLHANNLDAVYMSTPNNPLRYSVENNGTGAFADLECICSCVISEGGQEATGTDYWYSTEGTHVNANVAGNVYAVLGVQLTDGHRGEDVDIHSMNMLTETNDNYEWMIYKNPTVGGTFTYNTAAYGPFDVAKGATSNTITAGDQIAGGFGSKGSSIGSDIDFEGSFGESINGTKDTFVLAVRPLGANADIQGGMILRVNH